MLQQNGDVNNTLVVVEQPQNSVEVLPNAPVAAKHLPNQVEAIEEVSVRVVSYN